MRTILCCCIAFIIQFLAPSPCIGQPLDAGAEEIQVSTSTANAWVAPPTIMRNEDGHTWIFWRGASRWYHPDLRPEGLPFDAYGYAGTAMYAGNDMWVIFNEHGRQFRLLLVQPGGIIDTTSIMFTTRYVYDPTHHGFSENEWVTDQALIRAGNSCIFTTGRHYEGHQGAGLDWSSATAEIWILDRPTRDVRLLRDIDLYTGDLSITHAPQCIASNPMDGSVLVLERYEQGSGMVRAVRVLDLAHMQLGPEKRVDTVNFWGNYYGSTVLRYRADQIDVLSKKENVGGLSIDRIDTSGHILETFLNWDLSAVNASDYFAGKLSDGRNVLIWSQQVNNNTGNLFAAIFDSMWQRISPPRKVNSIERGMNTRATMSIHNDTLTIAWHSNRSGEGHVYLRRFSATQLTATQPPDAIPQSLTVSPPYPNPVAAGTRSVSIPLLARNSGALRVTLFDYLGREAHSFHQDVQPGRQLLRCELPALLPGVYLLRITDGSEMVVRRLVIQ